MNPRAVSFSQQARLALQNAQLQQGLKSVTARFVSAQRQAAAETPGWEDLRSRAHAIKKETIQRLDTYLEQFAGQVVANGGRVHWASDAGEACRYVSQLARQRRVRLVVKSKSMVTEEIGLREFLEAEEIEVIETDLGEFIVQLAGEQPSHLLAPAIHKTRDDVAQLFADKLGIEPTQELEGLTAAARLALRDKFLRADLGVSGVNFGIAETGTIVIVENEGNARLTTSLPRIHVAIMGIEKVIPRMDDLAVFMKLLPRSATGQKISSYVSLITGIKKLPSQEGPEEFHLVLLDNGRTRILADPVQRESLYCLRCGACLNVCPVYQKVGGHAYGWIYQGPIGALLTPQLLGLRQARELPFASTLCGACREVCPVKINFPALLLDLRSKANQWANRQSVSLSVREALAMKGFTFVMRHRWLYQLCAQVARTIQRPFVRDGYLAVRRIPGLARWMQSREFPALAPRSFRDHWRLARKADHD